MKKTFKIFIFLVYALYLAAANLEPVYEPSHTMLRAGKKYYILPFSGGSSNGGITIASTRNRTCPLDVSQELKAYKQGLGVSFHQVNVSASVIRVSTDLTIEFSTAKACAQSSVWKVDDYDNLRRRYFVTIGGVERKQGGGSLRGSFRIDKEKDGYKIVYCTPVDCITKPCNRVCKNVGVYYQQGGILLALADEPLVVMFRKVFKA